MIFQSRSDGIFKHRSFHYQSLIFAKLRNFLWSQPLQDAPVQINLNSYSPNENSDRLFLVINFRFFFISQTAFVFSGVFMPLFRFSSDQRFWSDVHLIKNCQIAKVFKKLFIISISFLFLISSTNNFIYVFCLWFL